MYIVHGCLDIFCALQVVDLHSSELVHTFTPCRDLHDQELPPTEPPITKMFTSSDGQWLAAINCFGDVYVFNLEIQRYETIPDSLILLPLASDLDSGTMLWIYLLSFIATI